MNEALWDRRYSKSGFAYGQEPNDWLVEALQAIEATWKQRKPRPLEDDEENATDNDSPVNICGEVRILSLGEGEGRNAVFLASRCDTWKVTAVDSSKMGLGKAKKWASSLGLSSRIKLVAADLEDYRIEEGYWDIIVSIFCPLTAPLRRRVHKAVTRGLRPGGFVVLEAFTEQQLGRRSGGPPDLERLLSAQALAEDFSGLRILVLEEKDRDLQEGAYHRGDAAVVQLLAMRESCEGVG